MDDDELARMVGFSAQEKMMGPELYQQHIESGRLAQEFAKADHEAHLKQDEALVAYTTARALMIHTVTIWLVPLGFLMNVMLGVLIWKVARW